MKSDPSIVSISEVTKEYAGSFVLRHINMEFLPNTIHGIIGANGAGKSTLVNILSGSIQASGGVIRVDGKKVAFHSPREAMGLGIVTMHQELELAPHLTIWENLWLDKLPLRFGFVNGSLAKSRSRELLTRVGLDIPVETPVNGLTVAQQQLIYLARTIREPMRMLILDEPSASLGKVEQEVLHQALLRLKSLNNLTIVLVSHKLDEVVALCDCITVLRDGEIAQNFLRENVHTDRLIDVMVGTDVQRETKNQPFGNRIVHEMNSASSVLCQLDRISTRKIRDVSLEIGCGLVTAVTGLAGSGHEDIPLIIAGVVRPSAGTLFYEGRPTRLTRRKATQWGIAFVPEDRKTSGIFPSLTITDNILVTGYPTSKGIISSQRGWRTVNDLVRQFRIVGYSSVKPVNHLSGGNQQKVLIARWIHRSTKLLVMSEPTRGIDVTARTDIHRFLRSFAQTNNAAVLLASTDVDEMYQVADVIYTFADGRLSGRFEVAGSELDDVQRSVL